MAKRAPQLKAESGNVKHVGAPMPGTIAIVTVAVGRRLRAGMASATLEAMKMETAVRAEVGGEVAEVLARPGQQVDAKDLLIALS